MQCYRAADHCIPLSATKIVNLLLNDAVHFQDGHKLKVKVKVMFTLEKATKAQRGSRGIALLFL